MHTQASTRTLVMCAADTAYVKRNTQIQPPLSHLSTLHIYMFECLSLLSCSPSSSRVASVVRSSSTMGCRSSSRSQCLLLSSRSRKQRRDGRTEEEGGGGKGGLWGLGGAKNRERKRSQKGRKLKILPLAAESHWSQCK